jgi:DNA helicase HerA-like ATPase
MADTSILIGKSPEGEQRLALKRANRHGLVAGATGTGKTVTLQTLAESFARAGVSVFAADVKGDLSGIAAPGEPPPKWAAARAAEIGLTDYTPSAPPVVFWDLFGQQGHPVRTTVTEMGPLLLSRILDLSEAQEGALVIAFKMADDRVKAGDQGGLLLDLKDLRAALNDIAERADEVGKQYGLVSPQTVAAIQRKLLQLEMDGADKFFGEPALELTDLIRTTADGQGVVNLLAADKLMQSPRLYASFMLWLMSELWEELPEAGDLDRPKLVFFFDEAHLLFNDAPKELLDRIEQVARLIRSKGVGIYFITQSPTDIPDMVLAQLGNRFQHALRAYTPADQKAVRAAAASFRANSGVDVAKEIQELNIGEALVSTLDDKGAPTPVARTKVAPPRSRVGPLLPGERAVLMQASPMGGKYDKAIDRHSAHETLSGKKAAADAAGETAKAKAEREKEAAAAEKARIKEEAARAKQEAREEAAKEKARAKTTKAVTQVAGRVGSNLVSAIGRELVRGIFGTMKKRR